MPKDSFGNHTVDQGIPAWQSNASAPAHASGIRNLSRFFPSHAGARPRPVQVAPVLGSMYFGGSAVFSFAAALGLSLAAGRPRRRFGAKSSAVSSYSAIKAWIFSM